MAKIATCPSCTKQLGLPATWHETDRAECPECKTLFALDEVVQLNLPTARLVELPEQPPEVASESAQITATEVQPTDLPTTDPAMLTSWEERLKKVLGTASSDDEIGAEDSAVGEPTTVETPAVSSPSFEIDLDLEPRREGESAHTPLDLELPESFPYTASAAREAHTAEHEVAPPVTLAEFAAASEKTFPNTEESEVRSEQLSIETALSEELDVNADVADSGITFSQASELGFSKLAAFGIGPLAGCLLGLYGLLWMQGTRADYVGLTHVLPDALLPAEFRENQAEVATAQMTAEADETRQQEPTFPASRDTFTNKEVALSTRLKRDESVIPASSAQSIAPLKAIDPRVVAEFNQLADDATTALTEFETGDLSTESSIKQKGHAYMQLCKLAESMVMIEQMMLDPTTTAKVEQVRQWYQRITQQANLKAELAHIAGQWWEYDERRNSGIFFSGQVVKVQAEGGQTLHWVRLGNDENPPTIPVKFREGRFQQGSEVGIVGKVVSKQGDLSIRPFVEAAFGYKL